MTDRVGIILNPASGRGAALRRRPLLERSMRERGVEWPIRTTKGPGDAEALAREMAREGYGLILCAAGDGTLHEALNGLRGTDAALGVIPLGTGNDFARTIGIGTSLERALEAALRGRTRRIDVGERDGRWFLNIAGSGFDAVVAERINRGYRLLSGPAAYLAAALQTLASYRPTPMRVEVDGARHEGRGFLCAVANARSYGGGMLVAPAARVDDGLFDVIFAGEMSRGAALVTLLRVFRGRHLDHPRVFQWRGRTVAIESDPPLPVLIDGELDGRTPCRFSMRPQAALFRFPPPDQGSSGAAG